MTGPEREEDGPAERKALPPASEPELATPTVPDEPAVPDAAEPRPAPAVLGNVFDAVAGDERPRGEDLEYAVEVPRSALGRSFRARVPRTFERAGRSIARHTEGDDDPDVVVLHLGADLPARARLRLRGRGGMHARGTAGDLWIDIRIVDDPRSAAGVWIWVAVAALGAALALVFGR